ncbi:MAG TPA: FkbM family methyltransferase [Phenylobacterium sp.]|jgi:FkbM family methyltransferase|nr:FkbM family methyltransferase [Phenylobacterium sp.]
MTDPDTKTVQTRHGPMIGLAGDRYITRSLEVYGEFSGQEWDFLAQLVKPGMTVVEVGANIGAHSVPLARACNPGPLYVFEPQQRVFQILCANLALNGVKNALAYPEASGEHQGFVVVPPLDYGADYNFGGVSVLPDSAGAQGQKVRVTPIDSLNLTACHLLKVDVEGFEVQVLRGAADTIRRLRPLLYVENDRVAHQQEVISLIAELGYRMYWDLPPLFRPDNFNGYPDDIFGRVCSLNILGVPAERNTMVQYMELIDPDHWSSPLGRKR